MSENYTTDREFGWDDVIKNDESEFEIFPEGDYEFTVCKFERGRSSGKGKIPSSNMAILSLSIEAANGKIYTLTDNLILHSSMEWKLSSFFRAIGQKKHGEELRMDWTRVPGAHGKCHIIINEWTNDKGQKRTSNKIDKYYDPDHVNVPPAEPTDKPQGGEKKYW